MAAKKKKAEERALVAAPQIPDRVKTNNVTKTVECRLTEDELKNCSKTLAESIRAKHALEDTMAAFKAQKKSEITAINAQISLQTDLINSEKEYRAVPCELVLNYTTGRKTVTRKDTGEEIENVALTSDERQMELEV